MSDAGWSYELDLWRRGFRLVAGVDEVGCGPLAGPVVAAAVIWVPGECLSGLRDSKHLTPRARERAAGMIRRRALAWAIGAASVRYIERHNIRQAAFLAMYRALRRLSPAPDFVLVDGFCLPDLPWPQLALPHGDATSASVAAASIIAKVWRDALMERLDKRYPQYGFGRNRGYPTPTHRQALATYGPSPHHRRSFALLKEVDSTGEKSARSGRYFVGDGELK